MVDYLHVASALASLSVAIYAILVRRYEVDERAYNGYLETHNKYIGEWKSDGQRPRRYHRLYEKIETKRGFVSISPIGLSFKYQRKIGSLERIVRQFRLIRFIIDFLNPTSFTFHLITYFETGKNMRPWGALTKAVKDLNDLDDDNGWLNDITDDEYVAAHLSVVANHQYALMKRVKNLSRNLIAQALSLFLIISASLTSILLSFIAR